MGFLKRLFGGGETDSERAIRLAQEKNARETAAIRGRIERGEVAAADAEARSMDKGLGTYTEDERAEVATAHRGEVAERAAEDREAAAAATDAAEDIAA